MFFKHYVDRKFIYYTKYSKYNTRQNMTNGISYFRYATMKYI